MRSSGGCQLQPIPYDLQLRHKQRTVELAYQRFSGLGEEMVPEVRETIGSPKQWGYRTKITPHLDAPPKWARRAAIRTTVNGAGNEEDAVNEEVGEDGEGRRKWETRIGFERKGRPGVMDIEVSWISGQPTAPELLGG